MKFKLGDWVVPKDHPFTSPYMMMEIIDIRKIDLLKENQERSKKRKDKKNLWR